MVRPRAWGLALGAAVLGPVACQAIAGIEDKQLDPKYASGGSGNAAGHAGTSATSAQPPPRPPGPRQPSGSGVTRWFAARRVFLGTVDPTSPPGAPRKDANAWRRIGHDLDGKCTTLQQSISDSSGVCKKSPGAPDQALEDGELCRDDASGRLFAIGLSVLSGDFELDLHSKMTAGQVATFLLELTDLDSGPDDAFVPGALYVSVPTGTLPLWNGSDELPIDVASVATQEGGAPDAGKPDAAADAEAGTGSQLPPSRYVFPEGYLAGNVWVGDDFNSGPMQVPMFVFDRVTVVDAAALNLELTLDAAHDTVFGSILSAAASQEKLESQFRPIALQIVGCVDFLADALMNDFLLLGMDLANEPPTFVSATEQCGALSLGFGLDWVPVKQPKKVIAGLPPKTVCDGGI